MLVTDEMSPTPGAPSLTDREKTIVSLMGAGHSSPEIAAMLELSPRTVENRKRLIYEKLGVGSQGQAVAEAVRLGLLQPGGRGLFAPPAAGGPPPDPGEPGRDPGEPGRALLAVLMGPASRPRDDIARLLISEQVPLVTVQRHDDLLQDHWLLSQRGPIVVVLVDPQAEDWPAASLLCAPTVMVCSREDPRQPAIAMARRAGGLVTEADVIASGLAPTLTAAAQGLLVMSRCYIEALRKWAQSPPPAVPELTAREREILGLIARGHSVRQTARALGIATKTVENIQARLFRKLGARNRMDALTIADAWGLVERSVLPPAPDRPVRSMAQSPLRPRPV